MPTANSTSSVTTTAVPTLLSSPLRVPRRVGRVSSLSRWWTTVDVGSLVRLSLGFVVETVREGKRLRREWRRWQGVGDAPLGVCAGQSMFSHGSSPGCGSGVCLPLRARAWPASRAVFCAWHSWHADDKLWSSSVPPKWIGITWSTCVAVMVQRGPPMVQRWLSRLSARARCRSSGGCRCGRSMRSVVTLPKPC
jgi:hypothetical protein